MKTLLILIVLLTITGCASAPQGISRSQELQNILAQARIDRESGKITFEEHMQIMTKVINAMPDHNAADLAAEAQQLDSSRVLMETGARLLGGGGFGYNQPRLQTTCVQQGMFTQCW
jgi:starvation-inducible outer membrane lipoprotein